jgi:hypothetical protein
MCAQLQQLLLGFEDRRCIGPINKQMSIVQLARYALWLASVLELRQVLHVLCHIGTQNHPDYAFAKDLNIVFAHILEEIKLWLQHYAYGLSSVIVFLDWLIVVAKSSHGHLVDVVGVVKAVMVVVVTCGCDNCGYHVEVP